MPEVAGSPVFQFIHVVGLAGGVVVLFLTWLVIRLVTSSLHGLGNQITERRLEFSQFATISRFVIAVIGVGLAIAVSFSLSKDVMLAVGGTAAVTIGFALKDLAASVVAGVIIILDRPFQVGERVSFGGYYGEIIEIGLRSVRLLTLDESYVTIPNNKFLNDLVSTGNRASLDLLVQMDFYIGPNEDIGAAKHIVEEAVQSSRFVFPQRPWKVMVAQVLHEGYVTMRLRAKANVFDVRYEKAYESDVTERVMEGFAASGIRTPQLQILRQGVGGA